MTTEAPTKAVAKLNYDRPADGLPALQRLGDPLKAQIAAALPRFLAGNVDRMLRCLFTECQRTPRLLDCTPKSLFGGLIQVAQLGLELGGPAGQAYLLPFKAEATLCIGYKGFVTLAHRAGAKSFTPRVVRAGDTFGIEYGTRAELRHVPKFPPSDEVIGYYAVIHTPNGGVDFEYLTREQAEAHKARYALAKTGPWATNFDEMAMKTAIRKLAKRVPLSVEWVAAASLDEMADEGVPQQLAAAVVIEGEPEKPQLRDRLDRATGKKPPADHVPGVDDPANDALFNDSTGTPAAH
jgi:recombination protein RecT